MDIMIIMLLVAGLIFINQFSIHGTWYDWEDINNHETIGLVFAAIGLTMIAIRKKLIK